MGILLKICNANICPSLLNSKHAGFEHCHDYVCKASHPDLSTHLLVNSRLFYPAIEPWTGSGKLESLLIR
ncbi:hypothetical protein PsAD37_02451 [Pseudovibrio sp. Ad37]|nr:hypothetical protein PsAD37_02451 [Pseudovibrio sp. Ad37]